MKKKLKIKNEKLKIRNEKKLNLPFYHSKIGTKTFFFHF